MYTINGVSLQNEAREWRLLRRSQLITSFAKNLSSVTIPGRHGVLPGVPSFNSAPTATLVVRGPGSQVEALYSLFTQNGGVGLIALEDDTSRAAVFELASLDSQGLTAEDDLVDVTATIRIPSADWRATAVTTYGPETIGTAETEHEFLEGISADISDMDIFIAGDFGNFQLEDEGSGSWLKSVKTWPNVAGTGLLYVAATGQAFRATTAAPWTPTADMSDYVDVSGGGGFRITPVVVDDNPSDRIARVQLTVTSTTDVALTVRAKNAFIMRNGDI